MTARLRNLMLAVAAVGLALPQAGHADGDPAAGERAYRKCQACHEIGPDAKAKIGPPLTGIVGRTTASIEGFAYSDAMAALGAEGHVWTEEDLNTFLAKPRDFVAGTKMTFAGIRNDQERADLIAYLATFPQP
jgi:cytochrome c